ncbi:hypothetical protein BATDEDRAFT_91354 [Batrachochytrium dendrobatidis JAM81]|uniref:Chromo domain-containing protein n=2 Tax=Batrachochytrium dendrobatidis TaxID=109871 RepID=F4PAJ5_BATDJ|nr:uncharacterized protein BATDEDRAFT_91354 [Batrachochytrium dendrobatidis JAM81]EGF77697.1 hypothetical protein BATDEDRAFT_91354 [Batrachochytrium dendrobatidis JAM81]KAJ8323551.1 hypothetical protein O5D80_007863 [Batrachochytrium dendrobatidis]KAK5666126.1 hypothetical protein QVD99_006903 [Batrachochytrium dendrobatidis]OAJ43317.1 hypothetical protein BDEG_26684 [Batrachochytrium dendrobatidis JEL423]|eukprot:XP_006681806.1 hypothetical protein BATDEDRAFT_91354 [Batrachochytrium dendrobatidis JAM81]
MGVADESSDDSMHERTPSSDKSSKNGSSEESLDDEEFEVERIIKFRKHQGVEQFYIKWKGYPDSDNTWEPTDVVDAPDLVKEFWSTQASKGKKARTSTSRSRAIEPQASPPKRQKTPIAKNGKSASQPSRTSKKGATSKSASKPNPSSKKKTIEEEESSESLQKIYLSPDALTAEMRDKLSWENDVESIETMEMASSSTDDLLVYINWNDGKKIVVASKVANAKCPQKIIKFYENHLKFG